MRLILLAVLAATLHAQNIVLIAADQEYRSEEALPQLARILSTRHGFKCTVLYAVDPKDGTIDPGMPNIPGLDALAKADLLILFLRWVDLPDDPMMPVAWIKTYKGARVFNTTMGASQDLLNEGLRRLLVNACYWAVGREGKIPAKSDVRLVGEYTPTAFKMDGFKKGVKP